MENSISIFLETFPKYCCHGGGQVHCPASVAGQEPGDEDAGDEANDAQKNGSQV